MLFFSSVAAAFLLTNLDNDRFSRPGRIKVNLNGENTLLDIGRGIVLSVALDGEDFFWRARPKSAATP